MITKGKYNIVSGLGRSGTSTMMLCLRQAGIPITGFRWSYHFPDLTFNNRTLDFGLCFPNDRMKQTNKDGNWEILDMSIKTGITDYYKDIGFEGDVIKVFAGALHQSNPDLINKVIIMMRKPNIVLSSMINCGEFKAEQASEVSNIFADDISKCGIYLRKNYKEYMVVQYEELLEKPRATMMKVCEFLGRGDYEYGAKVINPKLNRSVARSDLGDISELEKIYNIAINNQL